MIFSAPTIPKIKISEDWEFYRLKRLAKIRYGLGQPPREKDGGIPIIRATNIERGKIIRKDLTHVDPEDVPWDRNPLLKKDDIIVVRSGAYTGDSAIIPKNYEGSIAGYDMVVSPIAIEPRYLAFALLSNFVLFDQIYLFRIRSAQPHLNAEELGEILVPFPPRREQTAIATFLDRKTAQIDRAVAIKEKQIALLRERKQILIQNAVTRGLDPDVPMRDSGVEWIGEIPGHWEVVANQTLFQERTERGREGLPLLSVSIHSAVSREELSDEENTHGRVKIEDKSKYSLVKPDDIVFNMMRAWQGAIGAVQVDGMVSPAYIVAKPIGTIHARFFEYQYRCSHFIQQMDRFSKGITDFRKRLYWHEFKRLVTVLPPFDEQTAIVAHIETQSQKIDHAIALQQQQIEKLKEYKATLINSAVTGKIRVPMDSEAEALPGTPRNESHGDEN